MKGWSLSTRLTLTLVVLVVVAQAISLFGFMRFQQAETGSWRLPVPVRIAAAAEALDRIPAVERDALLVAMNGEGTRFFITSGTPHGFRERTGILPGLYEGYGAALRGRDVRLLIPDAPRPRRPFLRRGEGTHYAFSVALEDGQRLVVAPGLSQRRKGLAAAVLMLNLAVGLIAALLVWRTVRGATRGLEAIAHASDRFAVDLDAPPMSEEGPMEARQVASAFNRMRERIQALMSERMRMLAAAAHDLKTLLTRLRLRVALIDDDGQRARGDRDIALMADLIEDVLLVARGEEKPAVLAPVDIDALLRDIAHERQALGQTVTLGRTDPGLVRADARALRRIVENLIENAVAYAGSAEAVFERDGDAWRILVIDHGPGLSGAFESQAFEPFARGESSRSRDTGGAGLGLSIARSLARQMDAEVTLERTAGGGLTVVVARGGEVDGLFHLPHCPPATVR